MTTFPTRRYRRVRQSAPLRRMTRETDLSADRFVYPLFAVPGTGVEKPVPSMPGVSQRSVDRLVEEAKSAHGEGIPAVILFGIPETKDAIGSSSWAEDGIVQETLGALSREVPDLLRIVDLCFCEYTDHGHCGVLREDGTLDNDLTLENLGKQAVSLAEAGAQVIAPSGMIDGMVGGIGEALDEAGHSELPILSYAAKFASAFYGPFRDAAESSPEHGDRKGHQLDPANLDEALREAATDVEEGADMIMVKPALAYLDVLLSLKTELGVPMGAYQVSGEYSMIQAAAERGWVDGDRVMMESLLSIRRAGADFVLTYFARRAAQLLGKGWTW